MRYVPLCGYVPFAAHEKSETFSMEPIGYDTVLFTFQHAATTMPFVLRTIRGRWAKAAIEAQSLDWKLESEFDGGSGLSRCIKLLRKSAHVVIDVFVNKEARLHLDRDAYTLSDSGVGPVAIHVRHRHDVQFRLGLIEELRGPEHRVCPPNPYGGWLCSPLLYEITVVTPEDPDRDAFSKGIVDIVLAAFREEGNHGAKAKGT